MTSVFDGLGGIVAGVFGGFVTHHPAVGPPVGRQWILREAPEDLLGLGDGSISGSTVILRVPRDQVATVAVGDEIVSGPRRFRLTARRAPPLQGSDALVTFELQEVIS